MSEMLSESVDVVVAPNAGLMTLTGTNSYVVGRDPCWIVDPGPRSPEHLDRLETVISRRGGLGGIVITHGHEDHSGGLLHFGSFDTDYSDQEEIGPLTAIATPGHSEDHFVFLTREGVCFSGDLILGSGFSVVPRGGGSLAAYMDSLSRVQELAPTLICPGHGPIVTDPAAKLNQYIEHREAREQALLMAIDRGERSRTALLAEIWSDVPRNLRPAAALVMEAHIEKLVSEGQIEDDLDQ